MSIWQHRENKKTNYKPSYSDLLFQKLLRSYRVQQKSCKIFDAKNNMQPSTMKLKKIETMPQINKVEPKQVIDLNKKMKLIKFNSNSDSNKENQSQNGHYNCTESINTLSEKVSSLKRDIDQDNTFKNFIVNQFALEVIQSQKINEDASLQNDQLYPSSQNLEKIEQAMRSEQKVEFEAQVLDYEQYPQIIMPLKQLSQYEFFDQKKILSLDEIIHENQLKDPNGQSGSQVFQEKSEQIKLSKQPTRKKIENVHIKNKISMRILKKKLQTLTPQEVVADLIQHRRIELQGLLSEPEKDTICEVLLSFMKNQLIQ